MLTHRHGGTITAIHAVGHQTIKGVADWYFIGDVEWQDGTKSKATQISPVAVCCDSAVDEQMAKWKRLHKVLNDYLESAGAWHEPKHKRDGRVFSWTPKAKEGSEPVQL